MISHALKYTNACNNNMSTQYDHTFVGGKGKGEWGTGPTADYFARQTKIGLLRACYFYFEYLNI